LEQIEVLGPLIATALDSITLGLPILGKLMGNVFAKIVALAPIPYAGPVGDIIAYFIALVFIMISATMSVSRKQFGTSFTVGVGAVPIIGDNISDAALLFEKQVERYEFNKNKILISLEGISPHLAEAIGSMLPDMKSNDSKKFVMLDWDLVFIDLLKKGIAKQGEDATFAMVPNPGALPSSAKELFKNPALKAQIGSKNVKGGRRKTRRLRR
jgi:hypothetical protein